MRLSAEIPGRRKGQGVDVKVSIDAGQIEFCVPTVDRAGAVEFDVDVKALQEAIEALSPARGGGNG